MTSQEAFEKWFEKYVCDMDYASADAAWEAALEWAAKGQEPICWQVWTNQEPLCIVQDEQALNVFQNREYVVHPLYLHPSPVPEGWKLVPIEPTEEMLNAGERDYQNKYSDMISPTPTEFHYELGGPMGYAYRAMLSAAPRYKE